MSYDSVSSARPERLAAYADVALGVSESLRVRAARLRRALNEVRASAAIRSAVHTIEPFDVDLIALSHAASRLGEFVGRVGRAFAAADGVDPGGVVRVMDTSLGSIPSPWMPALTLVHEGDRTILCTSAGADHVRLQSILGVTILEVNGHRRVLTDVEARHLVIRAGGGTDLIEVSPRFRLRVTVLGGSGNDDIGWQSASVGFALGGGGSDVIYGGRGHDRIDGGDGDDEVHGGTGHDYVDGQDGDDTVFAGDGTDSVYGGRGSDVLHGGAGQDHLEGGSGDDALFGERGHDSVSGGRGDDTWVDGDDDELYDVQVELEAPPGSSIRTPQPDWMTDAEYEAWLERITSDLDFLRSSPVGRESLRLLDDQSRGSDSGWNPFDDDRVITLVPAEDYPTNGWGVPASRHRMCWQHKLRVSIDPHTNAIYHHERADDDTADWDQLPPPAVLLHELAHSFDNLSGVPKETFTERGPNGGTETFGVTESNASGLDFYDGHPPVFSENALRAELGVPLRRSYGTPSPRTSSSSGGPRRARRDRTPGPGSGPQPL